MNGVTEPVYEVCDTSTYPSCQPTKSWALAKAKSRLESGFAFVGMTDSWESSLCLFHAKMGGRCLASELQNNRPTQGHGMSSSGTATANLRAGGYRDEHDDPLFELALRLFREDLSRYNVTPGRCALLNCPLTAADLEALSRW